MRAIVLASTALALVSTASAQTVEDRLNKARSEVNATQNAADRALYAIKKPDVAKATTEVNATKNAASRALYAIDKALEAVKGTTEPPPPPPPVEPVPPSGWIDSPTINGVADFVQPFAVDLGLGKSWGTGAIPPKESGGGVEPDGSVGAFRFTCDGDGQLNRDDMLVYPNQPAKAHGHYYWGNLLTNSDPDEARLKTAKTNCNKGPYPLNLSSYWMPWLEDDQGNVRLADLISGYYKRPSLGSAGCTGPKAEGICVGLPNRIRYVVGWDATKPDELPPINRAYWYCTKGTGKHYSNLDDLFNSGCTPGSQMIGDTTGYPCWDGKHLDSPDHRSHMALASYGWWGYPKCPDTHPYRLPTQENKPTWTVTEDMIGTRPDGTKYSRVRLSSDHLKANAKPGETLHADYEELWDARAKAMWVGNCVDKGLNCSGGDLGNGKQLSGASQPKYGWINPTPKVPKPN